MKKILVLALALIAFAGCKEDKEFRTPAFDATKNNQPWKGEGFVAYRDGNDRFNIKANLANETVILSLNEPTVGDYSITSTSNAVATYQDAIGTVFSTENEPNSDLTLYPVGGDLIIDEYNSVENYVSGRFQFSAFTDDGTQGVTFSGTANNDSDPKRYGVFYKVNIAGGNVSGLTACDIAQSASLSASTTYAATSPGADNFLNVCVAYRDALENQIAECGDDSQGSLQGILDSLSCINTTDCDLASNASANALADYNATNPSDANYPTVCQDYKAALENEIAECGDPSGSLQDEIDLLGTCQ